MVEPFCGYKTKFGSCHPTEEIAKLREKDEEKSDFIQRFLELFNLDFSNLYYSQYYECAQILYDHRDKILSFVNNYDFIDKVNEMKEEWVNDFSSSHVAGFGYNPKEKMLTVEFFGTKRNPENQIYDYYDVPADIFSEMKDASSKGEYLTDHIRGVFRYDKRQT